MSTFDRFSSGYEDLLADPLRSRFAGDASFFIHEKCRALTRDARGCLPPGRLRVLDVGCGTGVAMDFLRDRWSVAGADVSLGMLREAAPHLPRVLQPSGTLPFRDGAFDLAYAFCVYHHIPEAERLRHLQEMARVVRPGGLVYVFEHNPHNPVTRRIFERAPVDAGCTMIPPRKLRALFETAGFAEVARKFVLFVPQKLHPVLGSLERYLGWLPLGGQYFLRGTRRSLAEADRLK